MGISYINIRILNVAFKTDLSLIGIWHDFLKTLTMVSVIPNFFSIFIRKIVVS